MRKKLSSESRKPHIVVFPFPAQGHLLPLLDLTHQLCLRGVTASVIVTPGNLTHLSPLLSAHPTSVSSVVFPFPPHHPSLPSSSGVENVKDVGNSGILPIMASLRQLGEPITLWFRSHPNPPLALISDSFLGWTHHLCDQLGLPRFVFFSASSFFVSVLHFCFDNIKSSTDPVHLLDLPRSPIFKVEHLPSVFQRYLRTPSPDILEAVREFTVNSLSYGSVFNSSVCVEDEYLEYVKQSVVMGHDRFYVTGPLCSIEPGLKPESGSLDSSLLTWLDGSPDGSVLYVCFGSQKSLTEHQCHALALGLERSMTRFVWVVKKDPIPDGFEDRVSGRGIVVRGWVSQLLVLRHVAVGGFLSHCGWNSVLEGVTSGAVILGWPMEADQFLNARLLVEHLGAAVRVCEGAETVPDPDDLGRVIAETMGEGGREVAARAEELRRKIDAEANGSSIAHLQRLVEEFGKL